MSITVPPDFKRIASTILARALFAFQTENDIFRWCLKTGLSELARRGKDEEVTNEASTMAAWMRAAGLEMEHARYLDVLTFIEASAKKLVESGHREKAQALAERVWQTVDKIGDRYWRDQYRKKTKKILDEVGKHG